MPSRDLVLIAILTICAVQGACSDEEDPATPHDVSITFQALVGAQPADCASVYSGLGDSGVEARLADARLFVSQVELRASTGEWQTVELVDSEWQHDGVALLDFEDGTGACADSGTNETNTLVAGVVPNGLYDGVRFRVEVPFELNHVDNATAPAPFNVPGMFWTWPGGDKFLRVDWMVTGGSVPRWNVHIGSTGCMSTAPTEAPTARCSRPNASRIEVSDFDVDSDILTIDLAAIVTLADLSANTQDTPPGCMSSPSEPQDCAAVFSSLGLSFDAGDCVENCSTQTIFSAAP